MKHTIRCLLFMVVCLFAATQAAFASIQVGDTIKFQDSVGSGPGGQFSVYKGGAYQFETFCIEKNENIDFSTSFKVDSISKSAVAGGVGGGNPDPISNATAWLFYNFTIGTLNTLVPGYTYNNVVSADALQNAIWYSEEEISVLPAGLATTIYNTAFNADATVAYANTFVMNISYPNGTLAQSQLYVVPEASTIAVWSVLSLVGAGVAYRKRMATKA